ncbi:MAG: aldehyde dehydrogenase family protein [Bradymonadales bacterium]|nr:MAG: aldehyde dehydrogenase family protein [Bradymonadales bacterium]
MSEAFSESKINSSELKDRMEALRAFFESRKSQSLEFRLSQLRSLQAELQKREKDLFEALRADLNRPPFEAWTGEIQPIFRELDLMIRKLPRWSRPKRLSTPWWRIAHFLSSAELSREPYGLSLIFSPWNYPLQLALLPLMGSMAAGNVSVLKPSEQSPNSSQLLYEILTASVQADFVQVFLGGPSVAQELMEHRFEKLFFTGSTQTGRELYQKAAKQLASVTLELGGRCPSVIMPSANFEKAAERVLWGKAFNAGQTCVSPNHLYIPRKRVSDFVEIFKLYSARLEGHFSKLIHSRHFNRIQELAQSPAKQRICFGKERADANHFPLTLLIEASLDGAASKEEIFGPILPVYGFDSEDELQQWLQRDQDALAVYFFSSNESEISKYRALTRSGAFVVNDLLVHLTHPELAFGGIGKSGLGAYHGRFSYECFSSLRSFERRPLWDRWGMRFPPYKNTLTKWVRDFI